MLRRTATPDLERKSYEQLLREQLAKLGLREAATGEPAPLSVTMEYRVNGRDVRVIETVLVEARDKPGGRGYFWEKEGFTFVAGPTVVSDTLFLPAMWALPGPEHIYYTHPLLLVNKDV